MHGVAFFLAAVEKRICREFVLASVPNLRAAGQEFNVVDFI
jgi:hypothetical protein